jgi:hypothetical protein
MNDEHFDPYDTTYYQTPIRPNLKVEVTSNIGGHNIVGKTSQANVFNPYEVHTKVDNNQGDKEEDFPDKIDLTRNAYAKSAENENITEEDPPLLEELGIVPENIKQKFVSVLTFHKIDKHILEDSDMAGPFFIFILFGLSLALV